MALACITGASSGIGKEFARQLSAKGFDLILVARSKETLEELAGTCRTNCEVFSCDLEKQVDCMRLVSYLAGRDVAVFINNAGFGSIGLFEESDLSRDLSMIDVNVRAVHLLTHEVLKQMKARGKGYILNTASAAGLMPGGPLMAAYYATKSYVVSLTNAVATELQQENSRVHICALCPGPVDTNFNNVAGVRFSLPGITAKACVAEALRGMKQKKTIIVPGWRMKVFAIAAKIAPNRVVLPIVLRSQAKKTNG